LHLRETSFARAFTFRKSRPLRRIKKELEESLAVQADA
jgi:hypothetical protein